MAKKKHAEPVAPPQPKGAAITTKTWGVNLDGDPPKPAKEGEAQEIIKQIKSCCSPTCEIARLCDRLSEIV